MADLIRSQIDLTLQEGLLTPLHVIVLQTPDPINVQICETLLNFEANPELETSPEFSMSGEEENLLDSECGRTPLQLLCMRPDLEYADPNDDLIKIGLLLAYVSNKNHFYKGHSCLTLAMLTGNLKILKVLLDSKLFNPNNVLGNDRGTALHVLVSTELQKITAYENSIKMCDLLIAKGADVLKKFKTPEKLIGTCVDYGYREIEAEKEARKTISSAKKDSRALKGKEKTAVKDYLKDHERVVAYLGDIAKKMSKDKETEGTVKKNRQTHYKEKEDGSEKGEKDGKNMEKNKGKEESLTGNQEKKENDKKTPESEKTKKNLPEAVEVTEIEKKEDTVKNEKRNSADKNSKGKNSDNKKEVKNGKKKMSNDTDGDRKKLKPEIKESEKLKTGTHSSDKVTVKNQKGPGRVRGTTLETFPEKLRQVFLEMYGTQFEIDVNELLMPYVVLRNGELYYRFHKKQTGQKEQYSLI